MQKSKIVELKNEIELMNEDNKWYEILLKLLKTSNDLSMSEYEIYGQWMLQNYPNEIEREYWFNIPCKPKKISKIINIKDNLSQKYRSVSFHSYL
jgi:tRNA A22 N-methylase